MQVDPAPQAHRRVVEAGEGSGPRLPFGVSEVKPRHFREMLKVAWQNRDNLGYAWKVLSKGVCDGCALGVAGLHDWTIDGVHLCLTRLALLRLNTMPAMDHGLLADVSRLRGRSNEELRELGRLAYPMLRRKGEPGFRRLAWSEAIELAASRIRAVPPRRVAMFVTARGVTNEVYYVAQKAARFIGTNHVDNAARLCHAPSTGAMKYALGCAASTCSYHDWYGADLIVFFGSNPANDQPVSMKYLHEARKFGTKIALVNPYLEPGMRRYWVPSSAGSAVFGTAITDWWFPVTQGGDIPFVYGVLQILIQRGWVNEGFIRSSTEGWDELRARVMSHHLSDLEAAAGLRATDFEEFATLLHQSRNAVFVWSMGITQHATGGDGVSMILNLGLARGYVGRAKNGLMPIRGHSSVQGGAEMGCYSTAFPGGKPVDAPHARELSQAYGFTVPDWPGMTSVEMVDRSAEGQIDVLYCVGGNFLRTLPDPDYVAEALARVPLRIHQDILVTDQMLLEPGGDVLLLPAKTRYEQDGGGIETSTERRVMFTPELPREVGEARAEWRILRDIAAAVHPERAGQLGCETGQAIREEIARVVPFYDGVQHLAKTGDAIQWGGERLCEGGRFMTADGKGHFRTVDLPAPRVKEGVAAKQFVVSTRRGKQFNTLIHAQVDPLTGAARDAVFINAREAEQMGLSAGERVVLISDTGRLEGSLFPTRLAPGNLQVHWPEGNVLLPRGVVETLGGVPDYNTTVRLERADASRSGAAPNVNPVPAGVAGAGGA